MNQFNCNVRAKKGHSVITVAVNFNVTTLHFIEAAVHEKIFSPLKHQKICFCFLN